MSEIKGELRIVLDQLKDSGSSKDEYNLVNEGGVTVAQCDAEEHAIAIRDRYNEHLKLVAQIENLIERFKLDSDYELGLEMGYAEKLIDSLTARS